MQKKEQDELDSHLTERQKKIVAIEAQLINKQQVEMSALKKKLESQALEHQRLREQEQNK